MEKEIKITTVILFFHLAHGEPVEGFDDDDVSVQRDGRQEVDGGARQEEH